MRNLIQTSSSSERGWGELLRRIAGPAHHDFRASVQGRNGAGAALRAACLIGAYSGLIWLMGHIGSALVASLSEWTDTTAAIGLVLAVTAAVAGSFGAQRLVRERQWPGAGHRQWGLQRGAVGLGGLAVFGLLWSSSFPIVVSVAVTVAAIALALHLGKAWKDAAPTDLERMVGLPTDAPADTAAATSPPGPIADQPLLSETAGPDPARAVRHNVPAPVEAPASPEVEDLDELLAELDGYVALDRVKREVRSVIAELRVEQRRSEIGLEAGIVLPSFRFEGPPGTAKTSIARLLTRILHSLGLLERGHLIELTRDELVGEYQGHTAKAMRARIDAAVGGVLFIDEAYSLFQGEGDSFGHEAINVLVKRIEDLRGQLVVVLAGYPEEMGRLMDANSGLRSRFPKVLHFEGYSPEQLGCIARKEVGDAGRMLTDGAGEELERALLEMHSTANKHFGNGRAVRNLWDEIRRAQSLRCEPDLDRLTADDLREVTASDVEAGYASYRATSDRATEQTTTSALILPGALA